MSVSNSNTLDMHYLFNLEEEGAFFHGASHRGFLRIIFMTWDKDGNLICDWCYKIVIPKEEATPKDKEFNQGQTKCFDCIEKTAPLPKSGKIEDLPDNFWAPEDPMREFLKKGEKV